MALSAAPQSAPKGKGPGPTWIVVQAGRHLWYDTIDTWTSRIFYITAADERTADDERLPLLIINPKGLPLPSLQCFFFEIIHKYNIYDNTNLKQMKKAK